MNAPLLPGRIEHWPLAGIKETCDHPNALLGHRRYLSCGQSYRWRRLAHWSPFLFICRVHEGGLRKTHASAKI